MAVEKASKKSDAVKVDKDEDALASLEALEAEVEGADEDVHDILVVRENRYRLEPEVSAMTMMKLSAASGPKTPVPEQMNSIRNFLEKIVIEEDRDAFLAYLEDARPVIGFDEINQILTDATEAVAARPTQQ